MLDFGVKTVNMNNEQVGPKALYVPPFYDVAFKTALAGPSWVAYLGQPGIGKSTMRVYHAHKLAKLATKQQPVTLGRLQERPRCLRRGGVRVPLRGSGRTYWQGV